MFSFPSSLIINMTYTQCGLPWWLSDKESACNAGEHCISALENREFLADNGQDLRFSEIPMPTAKYSLIRHWEILAKERLSLWNLGSNSQGIKESHTIESIKGNLMLARQRITW